MRLAASSLLGALLVNAAMVSAPLAGPGQALQFDGNTIAVIPDLPAMSFDTATPWTLEFWMYRASGTDVIHVIGKRGSCFGDGSMTFQIAGGTDYGFGCATPECGVSLGAIPLEAWTHVAVTCDGDSLRGYVNGHLLDQTAAVPNPLTNAPIVLGGSDGQCARFPGELDELRIWSVARDSTELQAAMACEIAPDTPGLVGYWRFDEPACSQVIEDLSPTGWDGVLGSYIGVDTEDAGRVASTAPVTCAAVTEEAPIARGHARGAAAVPADPGGDLRFNGGNYALIPDSPSIALSTVSSWTLEFLMNSDDDNGTVHVLGKRGSCSGGPDITLQVYRENGAYYGSWSGGGGLPSGPSPRRAGTTWRSPATAARFGHTWTRRSVQPRP